MTRVPLQCGPLTFEWSNALEGYYADVGAHQVQILTEDNGTHGHVSLSLAPPPEGHSPEEALQRLDEILSDFKALVR